MIWELVAARWVKDTKQRPTAAVVCTTLSQFAPSGSYFSVHPNIFRCLLIATPSKPALARTCIRGLLYYVLTLWKTDCRVPLTAPSGSDVQTVIPIPGLLEMHIESVLCVAFSPSSRHIASGSVDNTNLVWHAVMGKMLAAPFKGHAGWSASFAPDGKIRCTDRDTSGRPFGHTGDVTSVVFSADGTRIASGSNDKTRMESPLDLRLHDLGTFLLTNDISPDD